jgi:hypothetical protein
MHLSITLYEESSQYLEEEVVLDRFHCTCVVVLDRFHCTCVVVLDRFHCTCVVEFVYDAITKPDFRQMNQKSSANSTLK